MHPHALPTLTAPAAMHRPYRHPHLWLWAALLLLWLVLGAVIGNAQTVPTTIKLPLTGSVAPEGLGKLTLTKGDNARLRVALFDGPGLMDISTLTDLTLELYSSSEATTQVATPITLTPDQLNANLTLEQWNAGTAAHATFELSTPQTNVPMATRQITLWGVIYGTLPGGKRRTFAAGSVTLRNGNAGGTPPPDTLNPLYPTLSQILAMNAGLLEQIELLEARLDAIPGTQSGITADSTDITADNDAISTDADTAGAGGLLAQLQAQVAALTARIEELEAGGGGGGTSLTVDSDTITADNETITADQS